MITGTTSHKLDLISKNERGGNSFQIGWNGITPAGEPFLVTNITYDPLTVTGISQIYYTIGNINYITNYNPPATAFFNAKGVQTGTLESIHPTRFFTSDSGYNFETEGTNDIKEEAKMGLVFEPKVVDDLFIERMDLAVFEKHSRLAEIKNLTALLEYRNGYYNIKEDL